MRHAGRLEPGNQPRAVVEQRVELGRGDDQRRQALEVGQQRYRERARRSASSRR
jgi:hypothetical protein